jgi:predicted nuclease of restriction endonuclease-like (RecB) superfamily
MSSRKASRSSKKPTTGSPKKVAAPLRQSSVRASTRDVAPLVERVVAILDEARSRVVRTVNSTMVLAYWHVGREIVEFVQRGAKRAEYGEQVLEVLSARLQERVSRGYSVRNLRYFRSFYQTYADREPLIRDARGEFGTSLVPNPGEVGELVAAAGQQAPVTENARIRHAPCAESVGPLTGFSSRLSWTHYRTLLAVADVRARAFYEIEAEREEWSVPHLERQIHTQLFIRLLKSRDKDGVIDLARRGQSVERPIDLMKSPVVLDFLDLPESELLRERDLESAILNKLSQFLLELGKGFAFVARQKRLTFEDDEFYVDLVFYNIILKCHLLIDLKLGKLTHQDVGQMDSYVRLFDALGRTDGDGPTIGLILCAEKNETIARYSILNEHKQLFAAKYVTYLPSVEELERELERDRRIAEAIVETPGAAKPSSRKKRRKR